MSLPVSKPMRGWHGTVNNWPKVVKNRPVRVKTVILHEVAVVPVAMNRMPIAVGKRTGHLTWKPLGEESMQVSRRVK